MRPITFACVACFVLVPACKRGAPEPEQRAPQKLAWGAIVAPPQIGSNALPSPHAKAGTKPNPDAASEPHAVEPRPATAAEASVVNAVLARAIEQERTPAATRATSREQFEATLLRLETATSAAERQKVLAASATQLVGLSEAERDWRQRRLAEAQARVSEHEH